MDKKNNVKRRIQRLATQIIDFNPNTEKTKETQKKCIFKENKSSLRRTSSCSDEINRKIATILNENKKIIQKNSLSELQYEKKERQFNFNELVNKFKNMENKCKQTKRYRDPKTEKKTENIQKQEEIVKDLSTNNQTHIFREIHTRIIERQYNFKHLITLFNK
ncbi:hypothetical protein NGRA_1118 [Nosema granulosis]|uniref:Uncharacterized protein n=1 Tax=Nosema granulosis TaxID=83296 RepID=A0A9P6GZM0_9MICR|nr:hypothetical protein NGRA_1118 [Nosema granulosis]